MSQVVNQFARAETKTGTGVNANDVLFTMSDTTPYNTFTIMTTAGNVFVEGNIDGTSAGWGTVPLAMQDLGSTTPTTYVTATAATGRFYAIYGKFKVVRVKQSGATAATATILCGVT